MGTREPASEGFTFTPRSLAASPRQFGKTGADLKPIDGVNPEDPKFRAAQLQHRVSNAIREALLDRRLSLQRYLDSLARASVAGEGQQPEASTQADAGLGPIRPPGMSYDRTVRILRGETLMQLADVVHWAAAFTEVCFVLERAIQDASFQRLK